MGFLEIFALKLIYFLSYWQIKDCFSHFKAELEKILLSVIQKLIECSAFVPIAVLSNSCVGPLPRMTI